jgi:hypothetical protein
MPARSGHWQKVGPARLTGRRRGGVHRASATPRREFGDLQRALPSLTACRCARAAEQARVAVAVPAPPRGVAGHADVEPRPGGPCPCEPTSQPPSVLTQLPTTSQSRRTEERGSLNGDFRSGQSAALGGWSDARPALSRSRTSQRRFTRSLASTMRSLWQPRCIATGAAPGSVAARRRTLIWVVIAWSLTRRGLSLVGATPWSLPSAQRRDHSYRLGGVTERRGIRSSAIPRPKSEPPQDDNCRSRARPHLPSPHGRLARPRSLANTKEADVSWPSLTR